MDTKLLKTALACRCPRCQKGKIYKGGGLALVDRCPECGLELAANDNGDGPAVFLIFILGFSIVPLALIVDSIFAPPLWVHAVVWSILGLGMTVGMLRPAKALVLALEYKHKPYSWTQIPTRPKRQDQDEAPDNQQQPVIPEREET